MQTVTAELLDEIKERIVKALKPEKIILFGSYAWGEPKESSDVDLYIIVSETDQPVYKRCREVYKALRGINVAVDVLVQSHNDVDKRRQVGFV